MKLRFLCSLALFGVCFLAPEPTQAAESSATFVIPETVGELRALLTKEFNKKHRGDSFSVEAIEYWQGMLCLHKQQIKESRHSELKVLREKRERRSKVFTYIPEGSSSSKSSKRARKSSLVVSFSEAVKSFDGLSEEGLAFVQYFQVYDKSLVEHDSTIVARYLAGVSLEEKKKILPGLENLIHRLELLIEARKRSVGLKDSVLAWTKGGFDFRVKVGEFDLLKTTHLRLLRAVIRHEESLLGSLGSGRT